MRTGQVILRSSSADASGTHAGLLALRPARLDSLIHIERWGLRHRLPDSEQVRVHLTSSHKPAWLLPEVELPLRRHGIVGVRLRGQPSAKFFIHFLGNNGPLMTRPVEPGEIRWFDPPEDTAGLAFSVVVRGTGETHLDAVEVILPPPEADLPVGPYLTGALMASRFPSGPTTWPARFTSDFVSPDRVSIDGRELSLVAPDWRSVDDEDRTWQLLVHGFCFAHSILDFLPHGAKVLTELLLSWADAHPVRPHSTTVMAWNDMAVAKRTMAYLAVLDRLRFEPDADVLPLAEHLAKHAQWLAHPRNYLAGHDHGLYSDTSLAFAARALDVHPLADRWRSLAETRFRATSAAVIDPEEGTVREHSPAYVEAVAELLEERRRNGLADDLGDRLMERLQNTLSALTTPEGRLLPWGDTGLAHASPMPRASGVHGFPKTGWVVGHHPESTVALTSSFHSRNHKHRDELSFLYYDRSGPIVFEAGFPGYGYGSEARQFAESEEGHSGAYIRRGAPSDESSPPFGGAVAHPAANGEWQALLGWNPLLTDCMHRRVLFHHPELLVLVDLVTGQSARKVTRLFHIGPQHSVKLQADSVFLGERVLLVDWPRAPELRLLPPEKSLHFTSNGTATHTTVAATSHGPGILAATISPMSSPCGISRIDVVGSRSNIEMQVSLANGVDLQLAAVAGNLPRELRLSVS